MMLRNMVALAFFFVLATAALAEEKITDFDVGIDVQRDGDISVTETITVNAEGQEIQRGIFRDLPRYYVSDGYKLTYKYDIKSVEKNGKKEPYAVERFGNAFRIRIGDADVFLKSGSYEYKISYEVENQVRYFDSYDELYWNVTGSYWAFPIDVVQARITLPENARIIQEAAYTGYEGGTDRNYDYAMSNGAHTFKTTKALASRAGMTVSIGFEKGIIDPPSAGDKWARWWAVNASLVVLGFATLAMALFYLFSWVRFGRDPVKGPVFARYEAPEGLSPAAVHTIYKRGVSGYDAMTATIIDLSIKGKVRIDSDKKENARITHLKGSEAIEVDAPAEQLLKSLCSVGEQYVFDKKKSTSLYYIHERFKGDLSKEYGRPYFRWNRGFSIFAGFLSIAAIVLAVILALSWTPAHVAGIVALFLMALAGSYFLPAPTKIGQGVRTQIEGFKLYLKTAEQLQLNAVDINSDAPPPMSVERYERFLPYAIALGVEKPWTRHFEKLLPSEATSYEPHWGRGDFTRGRSVNKMTSALSSGISSSVSSAAPKSSGSSGSGGGGSSGGGGGGGGGGGW